MRVLEFFQSKQGEGIWTGQPSVFVRFFGCPLYCRYCDTAYTWSDGGEIKSVVELTPDEIVGRVLLYDLTHVVLTGGEPMISQEIAELTKLLKNFDCQITIETAGIVFQPVVCDLMSISPKLQNSIPLDRDTAIIRKHDRARSMPEIVQQLILRYNYQLKFVIDTKEDIDEMEEYLSHFHGIAPSKVLLMPLATDAETMNQKATWIEPFCRANGYGYCPRMQLVWYGNVRRT